MPRCEKQRLILPGNQSGSSARWPGTVNAVGSSFGRSSLLRKICRYEPKNT